MQVRLWTPAAFAKKTNSTKKPSGGTTVEGYFRNSDPFSMYNPRVRIDFSHMPNMSATTVPPYTYALIPNFGNRYYWITDWIHNEGIWEAQLQIDVLATYRDQIGESDLYVLRAAGESDPYLDDSKYPLTAKMSEQKQEVLNAWCLDPGADESQSAYLTPLWNIPRASGTYILGVYGPNASGVSYYACSYQGFYNLSYALYQFDPTASGLWDFLNVTLPEGFSKAMADPAQFIASVKWFPGVPFEVTGSTNLTLGYYSIGTIQGMQPLGNTTVGRYWVDFSIPKHPQEARGKYLDVDPYANYRLTLQPFGDFDLDSGKLINCTTVRAEWLADYTSGQAKLYIYGGHYEGTNFVRDTYLGLVESSFGVEVPLNQNTVNFSESISKTALIMGGIGALGAGAQALQSGIETLSVDSGAKSADSWRTFNRSVNLPQPQQQAPSVGENLKLWGEAFKETITDPIGTVKEVGAALLPSGELGSFIGSQIDKAKETYARPLGLLKDVASAALGGFKSFNPALQPKLHTVGGIGSFLTYTSGRGAMLTTTFYEIADEDNADLGRPLCKIRKPKNLGGYMICDNPKIEIIGTRAETDQIKDYLTGGFFYE